MGMTQNGFPNSKIIKWKERLLPDFRELRDDPLPRYFFAARHEIFLGGDHAAVMIVAKRLRRIRNWLEIELFPDKLQGLSAPARSVVRRQIQRLTILRHVF